MITYEPINNYYNSVVVIFPVKGFKKNPVISEEEFSNDRNPQTRNHGTNSASHISGVGHEKRGETNDRNNFTKCFYRENWSLM